MKRLLAFVKVVFPLLVKCFLLHVSVASRHCFVMQAASFFDKACLCEV